MMGPDKGPRFPTVIMLELYLIRPGATPFDEEGRIKGNLDLPLSETGWAQARHLADQLIGEQLETLYVAPTEAAEQTARCIAEKCRCRSRTLPLLENLDFGLWQGRMISEVRRTQPRVYRLFQESPETVCPPGGETVASAIERAHKALQYIGRKHRSGRIGVIASLPFGALVRAVVRGEAIGDLWQSELDFGTFEKMKVESTPGKNYELLEA
ncbi:MAG: histidine phosphatase family protein [Planctomycetota bacterium]|nr:MAG: histidine phosphatase family protein [Planctomycetota bacterium]